MHTDQQTDIVEENLKYPLTEVERINQEQIRINGHVFQIVSQTNDDSIVLDAIAKRYSDVLSQYDFIVGDWSYEQLRLKGFFEDTTPFVLQDRKIKHLPDYLLEFCNFGCEYFVLEHIRTEQEKNERNQYLKRKRRQNKKNSQFNKQQPKAQRLRGQSTTFKKKTQKMKQHKKVDGQRQTITQGNHQKNKRFKIRTLKG